MTISPRDSADRGLSPLARGAGRSSRRGHPGSLGGIRRLSLGRPRSDAASWARGCCESRIHSGPGNRVYFQQHQRAKVVLLTGGDKRNQDADIRVGREFGARACGRRPKKWDDWSDPFLGCGDYLETERRPWWHTCERRALEESRRGALCGCAGRCGPGEAVCRGSLATPDSAVKASTKHSPRVAIPSLRLFEGAPVSRVKVTRRYRLNR